MTGCRAGPRLRANSAIALKQYMRLGSFGESEGQFPNSVDWSVSQLSRQVGFPTQPTGPPPALFAQVTNAMYAGKPTPTVNLLLYILLHKLEDDKVSSWSALTARANSAIALEPLVRRNVSSPTQSTGRFTNSVDRSVSQLSRQDRSPPLFFQVETAMYAGKQTPTVNLLLYTLLHELADDKVSCWSALAR